MDRRGVGLLVVALVLLAAVVIPSANGRKIAGQAFAAPVPGPPSVGDCLLEPVVQTQQFDSLAGGPSTYRLLSIGPCTGSRFGEVVGVIPTGDARAQPRVTPDSTDGTDTGDPNLDRCARDLAIYSGSDAARRSPGTLQEWRSSAQIDLILGGPTALQIATGQHWVACIGFIGDANGGSTSYGRPLRDALAQGLLPPQASVCAATPDSKIVVQVPCNRPHRAEIFAYAFSVDGVSSKDLDASCLAFVQQFTGMADPTAAGKLQVYSARPETLGEATYVPSPVCLVAPVGTHTLVGPLIGLGDKAVPLR